MSNSATYPGLLASLSNSTVGGTSNTQSGDYTLQMCDTWGLPLVASTSSTQTITVPATTTMFSPRICRVEIIQSGTGAVTIAAASGVTILSPQGLVMPGQYSIAVLEKAGLNTWYLTFTTFRAPVGLLRSGAQIDHTGTAAKTTLVTYTMPAGLMQTNSTLQVETLWSFTGTNNKTITMSFGGTDYLSTTQTTNSSFSDIRSVTNRNATNSQVGANSGAAVYGASGVNVATSAVDTTAAVSVLLTAQLANTGEHIKLEWYRFTLLP